MAKIFAIVNQKGGVGKTTTAVNLSSYLTRHGRFTLLVDLDPQANATSGIGFGDREFRFTVYDALVNDASFALVRISTNQAGLHLAPSNQDLAGAAVELVNLPNREWRLHKALISVRHDYDYFIIDFPSHFGSLTV